MSSKIKEQMTMSSIKGVNCHVSKGANCHIIIKGANCHISKGANCHISKIREQTREQYATSAK